MAPEAAGPRSRPLSSFLNRVCQIFLIQGLDLQPKKYFLSVDSERTVSPRNSRVHTTDINIFNSIKDPFAGSPLLDKDYGRDRLNFLHALAKECLFNSPFFSSMLSSTSSVNLPPSKKFRPTSFGYGLLSLHRFAGKRSVSLCSLGCFADVPTKVSTFCARSQSSVSCALDSGRAEKLDNGPASM